MTYKEWTDLGISLFGKDRREWKFECPVCGHIASIQDYLNAGAPDGAIGFSCIGRWIKNSKKAFEMKRGEKGPCNYTGGGLFQRNPVEIEKDGIINKYFNFAIPHNCPQGKQDFKKCIKERSKTE